MDNLLGLLREGKLKDRHLASMASFGVNRLTSWLQTTPKGKYIICYTEKEKEVDAVAHSPEWQEISKILMDQTGLPLEGLEPTVECLTR